GVKLQAVRKAIEYAEGRLGIDRLLLRSDLSTFDGNIFIDHLGALVGLSAGGQVALRRIIERHLSRVERDETERPVRFYPDFVGVELTKNHRPISISPTVAFGRPTIA